MSKTKKKKRIKIQNNNEEESDVILNVDSLYETIEKRIALVMKPIIKPMVEDISYIRNLVNPRIIRLDDKSKEHDKRLDKIDNRPFKLAPLLFYAGMFCCNVIMVYIAIKSITP